MPCPYSGRARSLMPRAPAVSKSDHLEQERAVETKLPRPPCKHGRFISERVAAEAEHRTRGVLYARQPFLN